MRGAPTPGPLEPEKRSSGVGYVARGDEEQLAARRASPPHTRISCWRTRCCTPLRPGERCGAREPYLHHVAARPRGQRLARGDGCRRYARGGAVRPGAEGPLRRGGLRPHHDRPAPTAPAVDPARRAPRGRAGRGAAPRGQPPVHRSGRFLPARPRPGLRPAHLRGARPAARRAGPGDPGAGPSARPWGAQLARWFDAYVPRPGPVRTCAPTSYTEARDVPAARVVFCDAAPYDAGWSAPDRNRGPDEGARAGRNRAPARDRPAPARGGLPSAGPGAGDHGRVVRHPADPARARLSGSAGRLPAVHAQGGRSSDWSSRGSRAAPANATGGAASTWSWTRSGGCAHG